MSMKREHLDRKDWTVIIISLLVFFTALGLLLFETVLDEDSGREIVGTVVYRNRVAQRRYSNSVVWQDVEQAEEVRNLDSIRTDDRAEAIITLNRGTKIELDPLSMIVLDIKEEESNIILKRGSVFVSPTSTDTVKVKKGESSFFDFQSILRIFGDESDRVLVHSEGKVSLESANRIIDIQPDRIAEVEGTEVSEKGLALKTYAPKDNSRFFVNYNQNMELSFRWENSAKDSFQFFLSKDPFFQDVLQEKSTDSDNLQIRLSAGDYYWKVVSEKGSSMTKRFKIKERSRISIKEPLNEEKVVSDPGDLIPFSWTETELAKTYQLEISENETFTKSLQTWESGRPGISIELKPGVYFVRVRGVGTLPGTETVSSTIQMEVLTSDSKPTIDSQPDSEEAVDREEKDDDYDNDDNDDRKEIPTRQNTKPPITKQENVESKPSIPKIERNKMSPPRPIYPKSSVDMAGKNRLVFRWGGSPMVEEYELVLREEKAGGGEILKKKVKTTEFVLNDLTILDIGNFSWEVSAIGKNGERVKSPKIRFRILLSEDLSAPELDL